MEFGWASTNPVFLSSKFHVFIFPPTLLPIISLSVIGLLAISVVLFVVQFFLDETKHQYKVSDCYPQRLPDFDEQLLVRLRADITEEMDREIIAELRRDQEAEPTNWLEEGF